MLKAETQTQFSRQYHHPVLTYYSRLLPTTFRTTKHITNRLDVTIENIMFVS